MSHIYLSDSTSQTLIYEGQGTTRGSFYAYHRNLHNASLGLQGYTMTRMHLGQTIGGN